MQDIQLDENTRKRRQPMIPFTTEINLTGKTVDEKLNTLVWQLKKQNQELRIIINDLYREIKLLKEDVSKST